MYRSSTEINPWQLLLSTLLNTPLETLLVNEEEQTLHVTLSEELTANLEAILKRPEAIRAGINYRISRTDAAAVMPAVTEIVETPTAPTDENARQILNNLFGDLLVQCGLYEEPWQVANGYLSLHVPPQYSAMRKAGVQLLQQALAQASFQQLRNAFLARNETLPLESDTRGILATQADKIICFRESSHEINFDYNLLFQHVFPPVLQTSAAAASAETCSISIDKKHLMAYLSAVFSEGFVLYRESEDQVRPICLASERTLLQPLIIKIVLDCSGSLHSTWADYIANITAFIANLRVQAAHAQIQFFPFADTCTPSTVFSIQNESEIDAYVRGLKGNGNTLLYASIYHTLTTESQRFDQGDCVVVVFTDGQDNKTPNENKSAVAKQIASFQGRSNPPQIFTFGFGSDLNEELMQALATMTGAVYRKLIDQADFAQVLQLTGDMCTKRTLIEFIQNLPMDVQRFIVPAYEGRLSVAPQTLAIGARFQVGDVAYVAERQEPVAPQLPAVAEIVEPPVAPPAAPAVAQQAPIGWGTWLYNNTVTAGANAYEAAIDAVVQGCALQ